MPLPSPPPQKKSSFNSFCKYMYIEHRTLPSQAENKNPPHHPAFRNLKTVGIINTRVYIVAIGRGNIIVNAINTQFLNLSYIYCILIYSFKKLIVCISKRNM